MRFNLDGFSAGAANRLLLAAIHALPPKQTRGVAKGTCSENGIIITAESLCRGLRVCVHLEEGGILNSYEVQEGGFQFGISLGSLAAALKEGDNLQVVIDDEWVRVRRDETDGVYMEIRTHLRELSGEHVDQSSETLPNYPLALVIATDLLSYVLSEVQSTLGAYSESLVKISVRADSGICVSGEEVSTGQSFRVDVPNRAFRTETDSSFFSLRPFESMIICFKAWTLLSVSKFLNVIPGEKVVKLNLNENGLFLKTNLPGGRASHSSLCISAAVG